MEFDLKKESVYGLKNTLKGMEYFYNEFNQKYEQIINTKNMDTKILDEKLNEINFLFGAFLNQYQSLRDLVSRLGQENITWEILNDKKQERIFFKDIRNIYVHQGGLLIQTFSEGELYLAGPIYNIKQNGQIEELTPINKPIRDLVKIFFKGIVSYLLDLIEKNEIQIKFSYDNKDLSNQVEKNIKIPLEVKQMFKELNIDDILNNHREENLTEYLKKIENQLI